MTRVVDARRALLLVNPTARRGDQARARMVTDALGAAYCLTVRVPESAGALAAAAREAAERGMAAVFAAGGDGTVQLVAGALAGSSCALGILPAGTANDGARALGIGPNLRDAARQLAQARPRAVDLVDADGSAFYSVGGLGVVTAAALRASTWRAGGVAARAVVAALGPAVYRAAATAALLSSDARVRRYALSYLSPAGVRHDTMVEAHGAFVANLRYCGGGLAVPGTGAPDDGVFEMCFVAPTARVRLMTRFARLAAGAPVPEAAVRVIAAREAHLVCDSSDALLGDGERLVTGRVFHLQSRRQAVYVLQSAPW